MTTRRCHTCGDITGRRWAKYCDDCRWRTRGRRLHYTWDDTKDAYLRAYYSSFERHCGDRIGAIWGYPGWAVRKRATLLGLTRLTCLTARRPWTADELARLARWTSKRHPQWIAKQLGRSTTAVIVAMKRHDLSRRPDGYTQLDVAAAFGVERGTVERWQVRGWLPSSRVPRKGQCHAITERDLVAFITQHRHAFSLAKVDQPWFLDLLLTSERATRAA